MYRTSLCNCLETYDRTDAVFYKSTSCRKRIARPRMQSIWGQILWPEMSILLYFPKSERHARDRHRLLPRSVKRHIDQLIRKYGHVSLDTPKWTLSGNFILVLRGAMSPQISLHALEIDQCVIVVRLTARQAASSWALAHNSSYCVFYEATCRSTNIERNPTW